MKCQYCQTECREGDRFCDVCGTKLPERKIETAPQTENTQQFFADTTPSFFEEVAAQPAYTAPVVPVYAAPVAEPAPVAPTAPVDESAAREESVSSAMSYLDELLAKSTAQEEVQQEAAPQTAVPFVATAATATAVAFSANENTNSSSEPITYEAPVVEPAYEMPKAEEPTFTTPQAANEQAESAQTEKEANENTAHTSDVPPVMQTSLEPTNAYDKKSEPLSTGKFMLLELLRRIPVLGGIVALVLYLVWAFSSDTNENLKNYSRSQLIWMLISLAFVILLVVILVWVIGAYAADIESILRQYNFNINAI